MSKIVEVATAEIGTKEIPQNTNKNKYGEWFGFNGVAWCGIFVSWVYAHAGKALPDIGWKNGFAGCQYAVDFFKKKEWITDNPQAGDIVFYDWNADGRYDHTGIFKVKLNNTYFEAIEGNTSLTNDSNGGEVMLRTRKLKNVIFVHIP